MNIKQTSTPLPIKNGVKPSRQYLPKDQRYLGRTLLDFLSEYFCHIDKQIWQQRLKNGLIAFEDGTLADEMTSYIAGKTIYYYRHIDNFTEQRLADDEIILAITEHLIVVDKPHFLPVIPTGNFLQETLLTRLRLRPELQHLNVADITPIHRLDKDTAGVILFSHNKHSRGQYQQLFEQRKVQKIYEAIAPTRLDLNYPFTIQSRMVRSDKFYLTKEVTGEPNAHTIIELIENRGEYSLYRLYPITGKKHQLRVHMMRLNIPILNDGLYPVTMNIGETNYQNPLKLLAKQICLTDPVTNKKLCFQSSFCL